MPRVVPTLHPKSRFTSSLFATTLLASFFVVALPHVLPCPAPRGAFTDDGSCPTPGKRRRRKVIMEAEAGTQLENENSVKPSSINKETSRFLSQGAYTDGQNSSEQQGTRKIQRECPIPKPGGLVGEILGFRKISTTGTISKEDATMVRSFLGTDSSRRKDEEQSGRPP